MNISHLVLQAIDKYNMIERGDNVLAAVSGGADSVCMLHLLNSLKKDLGFKLGCAHVNHGIRGEEADKDELFVKELSKRLDIPFFSLKADVPAIAKEKGMTVEEAGRCVRYSFFDELKAKKGFTKIATAHNKNDNAETVLMRIIRGTGIDGLVGIPHTREDGVIRPILDVSRRDIEGYCKENGLEFCTDSTNTDNDYTRNKIRNQLIPSIEDDFNPGFTDALVRLSENAEEDVKFLNAYTERLLERLGFPLSSKIPNSLHIDSFKMIEKSIASRLIRLAADKVVKGIHLEKRHIDDIFNLLNKPTGVSIDLPKGLRAEINYGWLTFKGPEDMKKAAFQDGGFFTEILPGESTFVASVNKKITLRLEEAKNYKCKINEIAADFDKIGNQPLFLRSRREGDKIVWFSDGKTKKIKNVFIDQKIPKDDRDKIPLLTTGSEIIAIAGSRVSEKYKLTNESERALVIEYGTIEKQQNFD